MDFSLNDNDRETHNIIIILLEYNHVETNISCLLLELRNDSVHALAVVVSSHRKIKRQRNRKLKCWLMFVHTYIIHINTPNTPKRCWYFSKNIKIPFAINCHNNIFKHIELLKKKKINSIILCVCVSYT